MASYVYTCVQECGVVSANEVAARIGCRIPPEVALRRYELRRRQRNVRAQTNIIDRVGVGRKCVVADTLSQLAYCKHLCRSGRRGTAPKYYVSLDSN